MIFNWSHLVRFPETVCWGRCGHIISWTQITHSDHVHDAVASCPLYFFSPSPSKLINAHSMAFTPIHSFLLETFVFWKLSKRWHISHRFQCVVRGTDRVMKHNHLWIKLLSSRVFNLQVIISICSARDIFCFIRRFPQTARTAAKWCGVIPNVQSRLKLRSAHPLETSSPSIFISDAPGHLGLDSAVKLLINSLLRKEAISLRKTEASVDWLSLEIHGLLTLPVEQNCGLLLWLFSTSQ